MEVVAVQADIAHQLSVKHLVVVAVQKIVHL
jgi:hypothetical protein